MRRALTSLFVLAWPAVASAQLDIVEQHVALDLSGTDTRIELRVVLEATGPTEVLDLLTPPLTVSSATIDGTEVVLSPHPQEPRLARRVTLPRPLSIGDRVELAIIEAGTLECRSPFNSRVIICVRNADRTVLIPAQPGNAWYLVNLYATDPFTGTISVRAPAGRAVLVTQGEGTEQIDNGDGTATWRFSYSVPTEGLAISAGALSTVSTSEGFPVRADFDDRGADPAKITRAVELLSELGPIYGEMFGRMPVDHLQLVSVPVGFEFGAIGLLGTIFAGDFVFGSHDYLLEQGMAHELAHTWWGNLATAADPIQAPFFSESFAEYSAWRALGEIGGESVRTSGVRMNAVWYMYGRPEGEDVAILDTSGQRSPVFVHAIYHKGSTALRAIATLTGEELFTRALRRMLDLGYGGLSTQSLVAALAQEGAGDLREEISSWLEGTGYPKLIVRTSIEGEEAALAIELEGDFHLRLPIRVRASDGSYTETSVEVVEGSQEARVIMPKGTVALEVDPSWTGPREVRPTVIGDVSFDGVTDAFDLVEVALRQGTYFPTQRRIDGGYDPLYDVNGDRFVDERDLEAVVASVGE
jgi:hypothetical protein